MRLCAVGLALAAVACSVAPARPPELVRHAHRTMGAEVVVSIVTADGAAAESAAAAVFAEFDRLDALLSVWKPGSDVLRINQAAGREPVSVGRDTLEVLKAARQVSDWTGGKFDITFGALSDIWKFDHDQDNRIPGGDEIRARLPLVDYAAVSVDEAAGTAFVSRAGMRIHLGGIGKGFAVDHAIGILRARGFTNFMVQVGGDLYVAGRAPDGAWRLGLNDPRGAPHESFATVELSDRTFSTSGDYERFFVTGGTRYHHILDPDVGEPARLCRSVTIVAPTATIADGLSTGVFVMGPEAGMALVERLADVDAVIVTADNNVMISSGLQGRVVVRRPPTM